MSRAIIAGGFEDEVGQHTARVEASNVELTDGQELDLAQIKATIALGQRVAELTDKLGDYLGDDSHLDGLKVAVREGLESELT